MFLVPWSTWFHMEIHTLAGTLELVIGLIESIDSAFLFMVDFRVMFGGLIGFVARP